MIKKYFLLLAFLSPATFASYEFTPMSVTDFEYSMNGKPAFSFSFGDNKDDYFSLTIQCDTFKHSNLNKEFTFTNDGAEMTYTRSGVYASSQSKFDTFAKIKFIEKDLKKNKLKIETQGNLVDTNKLELLTTSNFLITFTPKQVIAIKKSCK